MRRSGAILALLLAVAWAGTAYATYDGPPFGHHDVREIVIVDHTGDARMTVGAQQAADLWNSAGANFHLTVQPGAVATDDATCYDSSIAGRIHLCMDTQYTYQGGFTSYDYEPGSTTHLRAAYVHICGVSPTFCYDFNDPSTVRRIVPHEVGHALGLYHQSTPSPGDTCSIMSVSCYSETLSAEDVSTLRALYGHSDGLVTTTTRASTTTTSSTSTTTTTLVTTTTLGSTTSTTVSAACAAVTAQYWLSPNLAYRAALRQWLVANGCPAP